MIQPISLLPFSAAILSAVLALMAAARPLRRTRTARWFHDLNVCAFMWTLAYFIQINWGTYPDPALAPMGTWQHALAWMIGIGVGGTATYLFLFAAVAAGLPFWSTRKGIAIAHIPFVYTVIVGVTNPIHGLFLGTSPVGGLMGGPLAIPHYLGTMALGISAGWLLVTTALKRHTAAGRRQAWTIGLAFAVPSAASIAFALAPVLGLEMPINPVPVLFPILNMVLGYQVLYHGLGDIVPLPTLAAIMDHAEIPLAFLDPDFRFVSVNTAFERQARHTEWEIVGRRYFDLFPDGWRAEAFDRAAAMHEPLEIRNDTGVFPQGPNEPERFWDWTLAPVGNKGGDRVGFVLSFTDVTDSVVERNLSARLGELDDLIHSSLTASDVLFRAVHQAAEAIAAESASLMVLRDGEPWLTPCCGAESAGWQPFVEDDYPHLSYVFHARKLLNTAEPAIDDRLNPALIKALGLRSVLALPLVHGGQALGALAFETYSKPTAFSDAHVAFARRFASSLALALDNARRFESERNIAQTLQESMLSLPPQLPEVEYANAYHSATEASRVGGDFYDLFDLEDGGIAERGDGEDESDLSAPDGERSVRYGVLRRALPRDWPHHLLQRRAPALADRADRRPSRASRRRLTPSRRAGRP